MNSNRTKDKIFTIFFNDIYTQGINYKIFNKTAKIVFSQDAEGDVFIPSSINADYNNYNSISISEGSFRNSKIISVKFADDSFIGTIPKNVFELSSIRSLHLPESSTY